MASTTITHTDRWVVSMSGEIDVASRVDVRLLTEALAVSEGGIDIDLGLVTFMDSSGWAAVRSAAEFLAGQGRKVRIVNPSPAVRHLTEAMAASRAQAGRVRAGRAFAAVS